MYKYIFSQLILFLTKRLHHMACEVQVFGRIINGKVPLCNNPRFRTGKYCIVHTCGRNGCLNMMGCRLHQCVANPSPFTWVHCGKDVFEKNTQYCIDHICPWGDGCRKSRYGCEIHVCPNCRDDRIYLNYKKCFNCLTYEDVLLTLITPNFYFGIIPKDIVDMIRSFKLYKKLKFYKGNNNPK